MTRTYDDIEAVTRLLEEKEKDLELTAHIGKDLLTENTRLKKQVEELENDVKVANENCIQLKYELNTKCNLLAALTNDEDAIVNEEESKFNFTYSRTKCLRSKYEWFSESFDSPTTNEPNSRNSYKMRR